MKKYEKHDKYNKYGKMGELMFNEIHYKATKSFIMVTGKLKIHAEQIQL